MLRVKDLKFSYRDKLVFENINFSVTNGEILIIMGLNGSGKSTLLRSLAQFLKYEGAVYLGEDNLKMLALNERAKKISYLPQKFLGERVTVFDAIMLGRKPYIKINPSKKDVEKVDEIINFLKLQGIKDKFCDEISGGELQKVFIGRALAQEPKLLLLDEPINHLDIYNQIEVMELISKIVKSLNIIAVIVLHDLNTALKYGDKFLFLKDKSVIQCENKSQITESLLFQIFNVKIKIKYFENSMVTIFIQ